MALKDLLRLLDPSLSEDALGLTETRLVEINASLRELARGINESPQMKDALALAEALRGLMKRLPDEFPGLKGLDVKELQTRIEALQGPAVVHMPYPRNDKPAEPLPEPVPPPMVVRGFRPDNE
jgi:hypothetical protein